MMINSMLGFVLATPVALVGGFIVGAVTSYLVLRNNAKLKAKLDEKVQKIDDKTNF
jgi:hypothetical protein